MYQKFLDGEDISKIPKEQDPFWEPTEDVLIGSANVFLQSLSYALDFDDKITITDYKGQEEGSLIVHVAPCKENGKAIEEDAFVDEPEELKGKPYHFKVAKIISIIITRFLPATCTCLISSWKFVVYSKCSGLSTYQIGLALNE